MKRALWIFLVSMMVLVATSAQAESGKVYFALGAGASLPTDIEEAGETISFDPGWNVTGALGYDFGMFRVEGEIGYRMFDLDELEVQGLGTFPVDGDVSALTFMGNGYFDIELGSAFTPYLGFGLGVADADIELTVPGFGTLEESSTEFSYQLMAGTAYDISSTMALTAGYRFFGIAESDSPDIHEFNAGVRFMF